MALLLACILGLPAPIHALSSLAKNDPYPVFSLLYEHEYLLTKKLLLAENDNRADERGDIFSISVAGFFQNADRGKPADGCIIIEPTTDNSISSCNNNVSTTVPSCDNVTVPLLDIGGRTAMIPLIFGHLPAGQSWGPKLTDARNNLYNNPAPDADITVENDIDPSEFFGYFSFPAAYKKRGMRLDLEALLLCGFGLHFQAGFASICQIAKPRINLTCSPHTPCEFCPTTSAVNVENVNDFLMDRFECIAREIDLNIANFQKTSADEIRLQLFWRDAYRLNLDRVEWLQMHVIPYIEGGFSFSPGRARNTNEFYGLPFGNNKHTAAGFTAGLDLNFIGTIQVGGAFGFTHFFDRDFDCFRLPTSKFQQNIFPFRTSVNVQPGNNLHFEGIILSRHFLDKLSIFFQYINLEHQPDCIKLNTPDPAFLPDILARKTGFKVKLANIGFTYDFTPHFSIGFLWQAPWFQRNAYRSTTVMFGVMGVF
jgi:hypothetical protein